MPYNLHTHTHTRNVSTPVLPPELFFLFSQGEYICVNSGISTTRQLTHLPPQSVHQSLSAADANQLWQTKPTTPWLSFFPLRLLIPPSYLTSTLTFFLFICLCSSCPCCSSTVTLCQRVTLKRLFYFYLAVFLTAGISFLNYTIKTELRAG